MKQTFICYLSFVFSFFAQAIYAQSYTVTSPDKSIRVEIEESDQIRYAVTFGGRTIMEKSDLGFGFKNESDMQKDLRVVRSIPSSHNETWMPVVRSKHAKIVDAYNELILVTEEKSDKRRRMDIVFRVYNDGVAFRYHLYRSEQIGNRLITKELTTFHIPGNPEAWVVEYGKYNTSNEAEFYKQTLDYVTDKTIAGMPFLMKYADDCWVALTEAEIDNFAAFYIGTDGRKNH
ncbi:MAG: glycoside hydrolase family 97 N-terminal domain-containing protein, partial [Tannerella sp.]|nr:glycoside hydrolase family 97 N-terminal domain-containing protein [Tannerella sp.]